MTALPADQELTNSFQNPGQVSKKDASGVKAGDVSSADPEEARLLAAARTDRAAFGALYDRYFDAIYHYIARRVGDADTAEDLAASVWERALIAIERYEQRGLPFTAWLYRIAGNVVANHFRQRRLWRIVPLLAHHARYEPTDDYIESATVATAFRALSTADQEILGLHYFAELNAIEIAAVLGCSPGAVHKRLARARDRLRQSLEGPGHGPR